IRCDLIQRNGHVQAASGSFAVDLPERVAVALRARSDLRNVVVGLRPEAVHLSLQQPPAESPACQAEVYAVEPLGDENIVDLRIGAAHGETLLQGGDAAALRARTAPAVRPRVGDKVWITPVAADVHVFDPQTEEAIGATPAVTPPQVAQAGRQRAGERPASRART